ncbi:MAG: sigma-70 family RNA polymerase sigma factor, partial [Janthinobacterium sp.]
LMPEPVAPPPEVRLMFLERLVELDRRLAALPAQARQAFLLVQLDGMGQQEVAAELGISLSTVKRHLARAALRCFFPEQHDG